jgi:hypothetical protein
MFRRVIYDVLVALQGGTPRVICRAYRKEAPPTGYQVSGAIGLPPYLPAMADAATAAILKNWYLNDILCIIALVSWAQRYK